MPTLPRLPAIDLSRLPRITLPQVPWRIPVPIPRRFPPGRLFREIAFFGYTMTAYDGDVENQEDIFAVLPLTGHVRRIVDDRGAAYKSDRDPAWSPDRHTLAIHYATETAPSSRLRLVSAATGAVTRDLVEGYSPEWLDSRTLLFLRTTTAADGPDVFAVDIPTLAVQQITDLGPGTEVTGISWHRTAGLAISYAVSSPSNAWHVAVVPVAAVAAARAPGGTPLGLGALAPLPLGRNVSAPDWSPGADKLALMTWEAGSPSRVGYLDIATAAFTLVPEPGSPDLNDAGPVFSPDGGVIAFVRGSEDTWSEIWLYTLVSRRVRQLTDDHDNRFKGGLDW